MSQILTTRWFIPAGGLLFFTAQILLSIFTPGFAGQRPYRAALLVLIGLTAGCAGWACGIVLSPIASQASGAAKVLAGFGVFWTGVVVGQLPKFSAALSQMALGSLSQATRIELLFGLGIFLFASCVTFNTRFTVTGLGP